MNQLTHAQIAPSKRQAFNVNPRNGSVPNESSYQDAQKIRVSSLVAGSITRVGPVLRAGDAFERATAFRGARPVTALAA